MFLQKKNGKQDVQSKVSDIVLGKEKPVEESNPEYEKLKHYIFELENHLTEAQKHAYRLVKRHRGIWESWWPLSIIANSCNLYFQYHFISLKNMNDVWLFFACALELGQALADFGKASKLLGACEENAVGKGFSELGAKSEMLSTKLQKEVYLVK